MKRLIVSPRAARDIDGIFDYTEEQWGLDQAITYTLGLKSSLQEICEGGRRGRKIPQLTKAYLIVTYQSHYLVYRETRQAIVLIRILHQRMNIGRHL
ncbi:MULTISPECIES: type II toxin-antitoxin system RelE/ParE family toxin [Rhizobium]|uniref:Toxin n=1 Tax=Rhizobium wuzhouense TaxID=1986026 RepID=A0ABX5NSP5_9HYPH|nr:MULTISPECIES: type II toxin-antitoxin system RelE/ParE family toxin [Rhizobium]PYB74057.1 type II toxin-antitoxin system RelE/ParE family toxin [Rhizobium wuzhouense]RKE80110.1 toxin ParE1/3/4 [Rhizobium sp. AG855]